MSLPAIATIKHSCDICPATFTKLRNLYAHNRNIHNVKCSAGRSKCPICEIKLRTRCNVNTHLIEIHNKEIKKEEVSFQCWGDFKAWKKTVERETSSQYNLKRSARTAVDGTEKYFFRCHREGSYVDKVGDQRRHRMKKQGTNKLDSICTSFIQLESNGCDINVTYWKTHYGHTPRVGRLNLTAEDRIKIAGLIECGETIDHILHTIKESATDSNIDRFHLITRADIKNIRKDFSHTKLIERMLKLEKNMPVGKIGAIKKAHVRSLLIDRCMISVIEDGKLWEVQSLSEPDACCIVAKHGRNCVADCKLKCPECNVCLHMFNCTCVDNCIKLNLCKHIHACATYSEERVVDVDTPEPNEEVYTADNEARDDSETIREKLQLIMGHAAQTSFSRKRSKKVLTWLDKALGEFTDGHSSSISKSGCTKQAHFGQLRLNETTKEIEMSPRPSLQSIFCIDFVETEIIHTGFDHNYTNRTE